MSNGVDVLATQLTCEPPATELAVSQLAAKEVAAKELASLASSSVLPGSELTSPVPPLEGEQTPDESCDMEDLSIADDLLMAIQNERRKGKWRRQSSSECQFDFEGLSPIEKGLLGLLARCLDKISALESTIKGRLEPVSTPPSPSSTTVDKLNKEVILLKKQNTALLSQNAELREGRLQDQTRSMRENLLLHGVVESDNENTEATLKTFLIDELKMDPEEVDNIQISASHRLGRKKTYREALENGQGVKKPVSPRPIVARFVIRDLKDKIKRDGNKTLRREGKGKIFKLSDQFPRPIVDRRKILMPILIDNIQSKNTVRLVVDSLLSTTGCTQILPRLG